MCGVVGIFTSGEDALLDVVNGLFQMQHRGQDACGIAITDGDRIRLHKELGYVRQVFADRPTPEFRGHLACGHVRYPTQGTNSAANAQPHMVSTLSGPTMALTSNGDITNYWERREELEAEGIDFIGDNDGELILKHIAFMHLRRGKSILEAIRDMQERVHGAFSARARGGHSYSAHRKTNRRFFWSISLKNGMPSRFATTRVPNFSETLAALALW